MCGPEPGEPVAEIPDTKAFPRAAGNNILGHEMCKKCQADTCLVARALNASALFVL